MMQSDSAEDRRKAIQQLSDAINLVLAFSIHTLPSEKAAVIQGAYEARTLSFRFTIDFEAHAQGWTATCNLVEENGAETLVDFADLVHPQLFLVKKNSNAENEEGG